MSDAQTTYKIQFTEKESIEAGLIAVFPSFESYKGFIHTDKGDIEPFVRLAVKNGIIQEQDSEKAFEVFIKAKTVSRENRTPPRGLTFRHLIEDKEKIETSIRGLCNWLNTLVKDLGLNFLPKGTISNAMFSRLKKSPANTSVKRNSLRLLSFWFGYKRTHLGPVWNYETLVKLCLKHEKILQERGVRISFALSGRGYNIDDKAVRWLKNELKDCLKDIQGMLSGRIQTYSNTMFYVDLSEEKLGALSLDHPQLYDSCIANALSVAHQISVRWKLSPFSSKDKILISGIAAGEFSSIDPVIQSILNAKLDEHALIRLTDYARLCVLINEIGVLFCKNPKDIETVSGEPLRIWWVKSFWNINQWNLIPQLLNQLILQPEPESQTELENLLWLHQDTSAKAKTKPGPVLTYLKDPHEVVLGLEIVKILFLRKKFYEAKEILRLILHVQPYNSAARSFRMIIYGNMGLNNSDPYYVSEQYFRLANADANFIKQNQPGNNEHFLCEYAMSKLIQAIKILRVIRENRGEYKERGVRLSKNNVYKLLDQAEQINVEAMALTPVNYRVLYWLLCIRSLRRILEQDGDIFKNKTKQILDPNGVCKETAQELMTILGREELGTLIFSKSSANIPKTYYDPKVINPIIDSYAYAIFHWDFNLNLTVDTVQNIIWLLIEALDTANKLKESKTGAYIPLRCCMEVMPIDTCIDYIKKTIGKIQETVGNLGELAQTETVDPDTSKKLTLFTLHI